MTDFVVMFTKHFGIEPSDYKPELTYNDVADWDSLAHMAIVAEMEEAHDIEFEVDEISEMTSAGRMLEILTTKIKEA